MEASDTVRLSEELEQDTEVIAHAVHRSWIQQRSSEGWEYGETYDREHKKTPFIVPYDALPESEKEMDRVTVRQVIRTLLQLGYRIERDNIC